MFLALRYMLIRPKTALFEPNRRKFQDNVTTLGLIIMMPLKMKELRKSPDGKNFLSIMETISKFYSKYSSTNLQEEFWNAELTHKDRVLIDEPIKIVYFYGP